VHLALSLGGWQLVPEPVTFDLAANHDGQRCPREIIEVLNVELVVLHREARRALALRDGHDAPHHEELSVSRL
jgi:hypothetical protein